MTHLPIPQIRKRLYELAEQHGLDELRELADASRRKPALRRAPARYTAKLTPEKQENIRYLAQTFPHMAMREIARRVGTDQGRVSETLNGIR